MNKLPKWKHVTYSDYTYAVYGGEIHCNFVILIVFAVAKICYVFFVTIYLVW